MDFIEKIIILNGDLNSNNYMNESNIIELK